MKHDDSAHVAHNSVAPKDLPALITEVYGALTGLERAADPALAGC
jgi:predicted transcriptional regulator